MFSNVCVKALSLLFLKHSWSGRFLPVKAQQMKMILIARMMMLNFLLTRIMLQLIKNGNILKPTKLRGFGHLWKLKQQDH